MQLLSPRTEKSTEEAALEAIVKQIDPSSVKTIVNGRTVKPRKFDSGEIFLPSPLNKLSICLCSDGSYYEGRALIFTSYKNEKLCLPDNEKIAEVLKSACKKLTKGNDNILLDEGMLFMSGDDPFFMFSKYSLFDSYELKFGTAGTMKRKLGQYNQFETDIKRFSDVLTTVLNALYEGETSNINYRFHI